MTTSHKARGSASRWGPLFGSRANDWAQTWEVPIGWGTPVYQYVLDRCAIGAGSRLLDCGCGAGRFARMAADRRVTVAGIDAAKELIEIAAERTPDGDFRVGDLEELPWPDRSFDWVTGFTSFQFADDSSRCSRCSSPKRWNACDRAGCLRSPIRAQSKKSSLLQVSRWRATRRSIVPLASRARMRPCALSLERDQPRLQSGTRESRKWHEQYARPFVGVLPTMVGSLGSRVSRNSS